MIDPNNPPKFVIVPYELMNAAFQTLGTLPWSRVSALMARLDAETQPVADQPMAMNGGAGVSAETRQ